MRSATTSPGESTPASRDGTEISSWRWTVSRVLFRASLAGRAARIIRLGPPLPTGSSNQPGVIARATRLLSGLASGGVYRALAVTSEAVRSYRTVSPLPAFTGGLLSVALSCESPRLVVNQHPALRSSDFPLATDSLSTTRRQRSPRPLRRLGGDMITTPARRSQPHLHAGGFADHPRATPWSYSARRHSTRGDAWIT